MTGISEYQTIRQEARSAAAIALTALGFIERSAGRWQNRQIDWGHWRGVVNVHVPDNFPYALPEVLIEESGDFRPHVDRAGKVCIASPTGLLLDFTRPAQIIEETLTRARQLLEPANPEVRKREFAREYQSYWGMEGVGSAKVSISSRDPEGPLHAELVSGKGFALIAAFDPQTLARWKASLEIKGSNPVPCYLARVSEILPVPPRDRAWTLSELLTHVENRCEKEQFERLSVWLKATRVPVAIVVAMPSSDAHGSVACAYIPFPNSDHVRAKRRKFREGKFPPEWASKLALSEPVKSLKTDRIDQEFLIERCGGDPSVSSTSACVFGIGSVGSFLAIALARAGVGILRLVDPDIVTAANIHRHVLGAVAIGRPKSQALAWEITQKLPNVLVEHQMESAEKILATSATFASECDLVASATGEETVELAIAMRLTNRVHRLHVWLEPLGLGGHVLALPRDANRGCLRCLFDHDENGVFSNLASLAKPGQAFQRNLAGCVGSFTPFGASDAEFISATAAGWATRLLLDQVSRPVLVSWVNDRSRLLKAGFELSRRGQLLEEGRMHVHENFVRPDCPTCGKS